jgi:hypothetical protein
VDDSVFGRDRNFFGESEWLIFCIGYGSVCRIPYLGAFILRSDQKSMVLKPMSEYSVFWSRVHTTVPSTIVQVAKLSFFPPLPGLVEVGKN